MLTDVVNLSARSKDDKCIICSDPLLYNKSFQCYTKESNKYYAMKTPHYYAKNLSEFLTINNRFFAFKYAELVVYNRIALIDKDDSFIKIDLTKSYQWHVDKLLMIEVFS